MQAQGDGVVTQAATGGDGPEQSAREGDNADADNEEVAVGGTDGKERDEQIMDAFLSNFSEVVSPIIDSPLALDSVVEQTQA